MVAIDFLDYLNAREMDEATLEILSNKEIMAQIAAADDSRRKNKADDFVPWDRVKRNV
jgi:hypothetical protein